MSISPAPVGTLPWRRPVPVVGRGLYGGLKDPCPVYDGERWHLFATGCRENYRYDVVHATAPHPRGPWTLLPPSRIDGADAPSACAPGVIAEGGRLHLFLQESYNLFGGSVRHLVSDDGGLSFQPSGTALTSIEGSSEAGLYDAHPAEIDGRKLLIYAGFSVVGQPDLHLARADSWDGPWERLGAVLCHEQVDCHNQPGDDDYEWGLEGGQLVELPDGRVLLAGVCFLPKLAPGTRQRVFFAVADEPTGPYTVLGPALEPLSGENGHPGVLVHDGELYLFFQHRTGPGKPWLLSCVSAPADSVPGSPDDLRTVA